MRKILTLCAICAFSLFATLAFCENYEVDCTGPGGHSNGAYGNVNAVHAAARILVALDTALPAAANDWEVTEFIGGNSVNSIAATGSFKITYSGSDASSFRTALDQAVETGRTAENSFRSVHDGDKSSTGVDIFIACTVK